MKLKLENMPNVGTDDPVGRGKTSIDIFEKETYEWLKAKAVKEGSLRKAGNNQLDMLRLKEEFLEKNLPRFKKLNFEDGMIVIHDKEKRIYTEIGLEKGYVHCTSCDSNDCEHVTYAYALPELGLLEPIKKR